MRGGRKELLYLGGPYLVLTYSFLKFSWVWRLCSSDIMFTDMYVKLKDILNIGKEYFPTV